MTLLDLLADVGAASVRLVWLPLAAWTLVWAVAEAGLWAGRRSHPAVRYRAAQAVLLALPLGLVVAASVEVPPLLPPLAPDLAPDLASPPAGALSQTTPPVGAVAPPVAAVALGVALVLWMGSAVVGLLRLAGGAVALRRLRGALSGTEVPGMERAAGRAVEQAGLRRPVRVIVADADVVPMTFGVWRPLVVVPASLAEPGLALAHEFVHVRQRDALGQWAEAVVGAVFGAHPGVRRLLRRCDLLREMACDAAVLADATVNRHAYASLVSAFATSRTPAAPVAVAMADSPYHVHQRLTAMKTLPVNAPARAVWLVAAATLALGTLAVTATGALAQSPPPPPPPPTPLVIIDGVATDRTPDDLDLANVYSVEVLKGETARAQYGEAGADGVILVTTRPVAGGPGGAVQVRIRGDAPPSAPTQAFERGLRIFEVQSDSGTQIIVGAPEGDPEGERAGPPPSPLYVVDGAVVESVPSDLDPDDIASIEVLKGEAAQARYGEAGADGVVLITTQAAASASAAPEVSAPEVQLLEPAAFSVRGVYPNPSAGDVSVAFDLPAEAEVQVEVFDVTGRRVKTLAPVRAAAGAGRSLRLDAADLAAGTYTYRLSAQTDTRTHTASGAFTIAR